MSVQLPGNSANTVCLTSEKGKVARQQQIVRQAGVFRAEKRKKHARNLGERGTPKISKNGGNLIF